MYSDAIDITEEEARVLRGTELGEEQIDMFSTELDAAELSEISRAGPTTQELEVGRAREEAEKYNTDAPEQLDMIDQFETEEIQNIEDLETIESQSFIRTKLNVSSINSSNTSSATSS